MRSLVLNNPLSYFLSLTNVLTSLTIFSHEEISDNTTFALIRSWASVAAFRAASAIFLVLIILTIFPYKLKIFSIYYLILVLMMDFVLFYIILSLWNNPSRENLGSLSRLLKFEMLLGLLAIFAGTFS